MKMRQYKPVARQGGFNLIEVIGAIAIGAIVIVGVIYGLGIGRDSANASNASSNLTLIQTNLRSMFSGPNYASLGTSLTSPTGGETLLINSGKAPTPMINGTTLQNSWGAEVLIVASNYNGGTNNSFSITYDTVPRSVCNDILSAVNPSFNVIVAGASGGAGTTIKNDAGATPVTYSQATAVTACNNTSNKMVFTST